MALHHDVGTYKDRLPTAGPCIPMYSHAICILGLSGVESDVVR